MASKNILSPPPPPSARVVLFAALYFKAVVVLLIIFIVAPIVRRDCIRSLLGCAVVCVISSFSQGKRVACFTFIVFLVAYDWFCSLHLPHGAVCWFAVCDYAAFLGHNHVRFTLYLEMYLESGCYRWQRVKKS